MAADTLYDLLGVSVTSRTQEIRSAYRKLSKVYHPDLGGTAEFFRQLQEGYEVLTDPIRRAAYDRSVAISTDQQLFPKEELGLGSLALASQGRKRHDIVSATWIMSVVVVGVLAGTLLESTHGMVLLLVVIMAIATWRRHELTKREVQRRERIATAAAELNRTAREAADRRNAAAHAATTSPRGTSHMA